MIIVADTSALVALATCEAIDLVEKLFGKVIVPKTVYQECIVFGKSQSERLEKYLFDKVEFIEKDIELQFPSNLGAGELEAMFLYKKKNADYLLIDDNRA